MFLHSFSSNGSSFLKYKFASLEKMIVLTTRFLHCMHLRLFHFFSLNISALVQIFKENKISTTAFIMSNILFIFLPYMSYRYKKKNKGKIIDYNANIIIKKCVWIKYDTNIVINNITLFKVIMKTVIQ